MSLSTFQHHMQLSLHLTSKHECTEVQYPENSPSKILTSESQEEAKYKIQKLNTLIAEILFSHIYIQSNPQAKGAKMLRKAYFIAVFQYQ